MEMVGQATQALVTRLLFLHPIVVGENVLHGPKMNITVIAARLHQIADDIEALAAKNGDHEFPDPGPPAHPKIVEDTREILCACRGQHAVAPEPGSLLAICFRPANLLCLLLGYLEVALVG
jgi:hypothetical protein